MNPMLELARAEGHRPKLPPAMPAEKPLYQDQAQAAYEYIKANPLSTVTEIRGGLALATKRVRYLVDGLVRDGRVIAAPRSGHGRFYHRYEVKQ